MVGSIKIKFGTNFFVVMSLSSLTMSIAGTQGIALPTPVWAPVARRCTHCGLSAPGSWEQRYLFLSCCAGMLVLIRQILQAALRLQK